MKTSIKNLFLLHRPDSSPRSSTFQTIRRCAAVFTASVAVISSASAATAAFGDFNNDGLMDVAAITSPTTVTVSLANLDGSYTVSAILSAPKNQKITDVGLNDQNSDGEMDVYANSPAGGSWVYTHLWSGNGDGTFGSRTTVKWSWPPKGNYGSW
jgi:hypothetical protein